MEFVRHTPVMVEQVAGYLLTASGVCYVDATLGTGGHAEHLLRRTAAGAGGRKPAAFIGIDRDPAALREARRRLRPFKGRITFVRGNFRGIAGILSGRECDGFLLDLGMSSLQLEDRTRGFSYMQDGPLDMSMGPASRSVIDLLAASTQRDIAVIIRKFGEERRHRAIAREIVKARDSGSMKRTSQLRAAVAKAVHAKDLTPALSRVFQAFRIWANEELENLEEFLGQAVDLLKPGGRLVIVSYHSLEDRIVKRFFRQEQKGCICPPGFPECRCGRTARLRIITRRPVTPSAEEVLDNPRARSAKLRAAERL
jgi:16S rRNA (cytosine1402-N4)-methyltransferase